MYLTQYLKPQQTDADNSIKTKFYDILSIGKRATTSNSLYLPPLEWIFPKYSPIRRNEPIAVYGISMI